MKEITKLSLQTVGFFLAVGLLLTLLERTGRSYWQIWLALAALAILSFSVWAVLNKRRGRRLDAQYGFSIVHLPMRSARIQAFHAGVPSFSIPFDLDQKPECINFTAALIDIPESERQAVRERLVEYMKQRWGRFEIV